MIRNALSRGISRHSALRITAACSGMNADNSLSTWRAFLPKNEARSHAARLGQCRRVNNSITPIVVEKTSRGDYMFDVFSRLLRERIILLTGPIDDVCSTQIISQLLYLEASNSDRPLQLCINSPGGVVSSGLAIYDTMQYIRSPVITLCMGQACSMASLLLAAGTPGKRYILPNSRVMIHQPSGGYTGTASDIAIQAKEISEIKKRVNDIYAKHTKQPIEWIEKALDRDTYLDSENAIKHGIVDSLAPPKTGISTYNIELEKGTT